MQKKAILTTISILAIFIIAGVSAFIVNNQTQDVLQYSELFLVNEIDENKEFPNPDIDYNELTLEGTEYSKLLDNNIDENDFNVYEIDTSSMKVIKPENIDTSKDALIRIKDGENIIGQGIIYSTPRGCAQYCGEGELDALYEVNLDEGFYNEYRANWISSNESNLEISFNQNFKFKHIVMNYFKPIDPSSTLPDFNMELGFIITDLDIKEFDEQLFEVWKNYEMNVKYLEVTGDVDYK